MNDFWAIIPRTVRKSKILNADEKQLWYEIAENLDNAGCCKLTNSELSKIFGVSIQAISGRLSSMVDKGYLCITYETRNHARRLYPKYPDEVDEQKPQEDRMQLKIEKLQEACEKGIKISDFYFKSLIDKLKFSPVLDEIEDNSTQFALSLEQIVFLGKFITLFPNKVIDIQLSSVMKEINYEDLIRQLELSNFLKENNNLSLKWCIENYEDIVEKKKYKTYSNYQVSGEYKGRSYSRDELNALIQSVDEIEL